MRVVGGGSRRDDMKRRTVVYDDGVELKDVDQDETTIAVVLFVEEGASFDFLGKRDVPPVAEWDGISSRSFEAAITKGCERWHPGYDVGDGSLPNDVQLGEKFLSKEIDLLVHRLVYVELELQLVYHPGRPLYRVIDVLDLVLGRTGEVARLEGETYAAELG